MINLENKNADKSAFSCASDSGVMREGLSKREYFAGLAMQGMLANSYPDTMGFNEEQIAKIAINYTDELLKQLQND